MIAYLHIRLKFTYTFIIIKVQNTSPTQLSSKVENLYHLLVPNFSPVLFSTSIPSSLLPSILGGRLLLKQLDLKFCVSVSRFNWCTETSGQGLLERGVYFMKHWCSSTLGLTLRTPYTLPGRHLIELRQSYDSARLLSILLLRLRRFHGTEKIKSKRKGPLNFSSQFVDSETKEYRLYSKTIHQYLHYSKTQLLTLSF